jgi:hypothetical protein
MAGLGGGEARANGGKHAKSLKRRMHFQGDHPGSEGAGFCPVLRARARVMHRCSMTPAARSVHRHLPKERRRGSPRTCSGLERVVGPSPRPVPLLPYPASDVGPVADSATPAAERKSVRRSGTESSRTLCWRGTIGTRNISYRFETDFCRLGDGSVPERDSFLSRRGTDGSNPVPSSRQSVSRGNSPT